MEDARYGRLLDLLYESAVDPDLTPKVLERLAEAVGAPYAALIQQDEATGKGHSIRWNIDPASGEYYYGHFATRNVLHNTPDPKATVRAWRPCVLTDENKLPKEDLLRSEFYNDYMRRFDFHSVLMIRVAVEGMESVTLNLSRPRCLEPFGPDEIALARRIQPHLIRAFHLGQKVSRVLGRANDLAAWMDRAPDALFLLCADGRISHMNKAARALLATRGPLRDACGRLTASRPDEARRLERIVAAAVSPDDDKRAGGAMALSLPGRRRPLQLTSVPLREGAGSRAIVCVSDLETGAGPGEHVLRELFGLTPAEARVAVALFDGASLQEAAATFGVSRNTVHNQLAGVFEKTGAGRQSELVRLIARMAKPQTD